MPDHYKKILEEIAPTSCRNSYCFYKTFFDLMRFDQRMLVQVKCIEMFKWDSNKDLSEDMGWEQAVKLWISEGWAQKFADVYNDDLTAHQIYEVMFNLGINNEKGSI